MAADKRTAWLAAYREMIGFFPFLSTFFRTTPRDIRNAESVKIDIKRNGRKVAPVISDFTAQGGKVKRSVYSNKEFVPPIVALSGDVAPGDLTEKIFGENEYDSADESYIMQLMEILLELGVEIDGQFMRHLEYQAAQIFQTGELTLQDANGNDAYTIDFFPKASHFPTVSTSWASTSTATPDADLRALYTQIKKDGKVNPKNIIFGENAYTYYITNTNVETKFDLRRVETGIFNPQEVNPDAMYLGDILIDGGVRVAAWKYDGYYENAAGTILPFVGTDKVIMLPEAGGQNVDFRRVWCKVPTITGIDPRFASLVPAQINTDQSRYTTRVWTDGGTDSLNMELKARPLSIPVSIDAFGCLDVIP